MKNRKNTIIKGDDKTPRVSVFRSNRYMSAQIIDDSKGITIASLSSKKIKGGNPSEKALALGKELAGFLKIKKITEAVFDRGNYRYHGQVKALAEGLREGGLKI